jgi:uncharacterized membrane protein
MFDIQSVAIDAPSDQVFAFIAEPSNLPRWAKAFTRADGRTAKLETPEGAVEIELRTDVSPDAGTIDWTMTFPNGAVASAYSRVTPDGTERSIYAFVLMPPPVPLEALEGAFEVQRKTLAEELVRLKSVVEAHDQD